MAANANVAAPINASVAANIGSDGAVAQSLADQQVDIHQDMDDVYGGGHRRQDATSTSSSTPAGRERSHERDRRPARGAAARQALARLARVEGLELLGEVSGSGYKEGAALARRADGQMVQLAPLMYGLLEEIDGERDMPRSPPRCPSGSGAASRPSTSSDRREARRAGPARRLRGQRAAAAPTRCWRCAGRSSSPIRRSRGASRAPFELLFRPWLLLPALVGFLVVCWFVLIHKGVASATAQAFDNPELLLLVLGLTRRLGGLPRDRPRRRVPLRRRPAGRDGRRHLPGLARVLHRRHRRLPAAAPRSRLRTDLGGIYFNAVIAVVTLGVWLATRVDALLLLIALQCSRSSRTSRR